MRTLFRVAMLGLLAFPALAQDVAAAPVPPSPLMSVLPLIGIFFVFYFLVIRPQQKQARKRQEALNALKKGDLVVTGGGAVGKITKVGDDHVHVEIAAGVEVKFMTSTISGLYTKPEAAVKVVADKKNPAVKNDNVGLSKSQIANDN
jgi:preprotein translocase subunit YajC